MEENIKIDKSAETLFSEYLKLLNEASRKIRENEHERLKLLNEYREIKKKFNLVSELLSSERKERLKKSLPVEKSVPIKINYRKNILLIAPESPITPTEAILEILNENWLGEFKPAYLRDQLAMLREVKLLKSKANNLLWLVHSSLRFLLKKELIEKGKRKGTYTGKTKKG